MPTIVLRHVTKHYRLGEAPDLNALDRVLFATTRIFDHTARTADERPHDTHEPPDRALALDDLSLTIHNGETLAVLGPSGCGKSTLLRVIAGLIRPDSGEVLYDGVPVHDTPVADRGIGMVFQSYALYPHMPAYDNIGFYDLLRKQPEKTPERLQMISKVMGVDLRHLLGRKPPTLSGGEQQRVAVARCLARDPRLFLFDEPLSNLDAKLRTETRVQIRRLLQHYHITSVYVTHDQTEAIALADRIALMRAGKIEQVGTFRALYDTPKNIFVAQFFGTPPMNLFQGFVRGAAWEGRGFSIAPFRPGLSEGQPVHLGIRPEQLVVADTGVPARVEMVEPVFSQQRQMAFLEIAGQPCAASLSLSTPLRPGATVHVQFPSDALYWFDSRSGQRIG